MVDEVGVEAALAHLLLAEPARQLMDDRASMLDLHTDALREALERVNVETLTPIEAMNVLYQLKQML